MLALQTTLIKQAVYCANLRMPMTVHWDRHLQYLCVHRRRCRPLMGLLVAVGLLILLKSRQGPRPPLATEISAPDIENENLEYEQKFKNKILEQPIAGKPDEIAIVVLASNRPEVQHLIGLLVALKPRLGFRILVSLDGREKQTTKVLQQIQSSDVSLLLDNDSSRNVTLSSDHGYSLIARHYLRVLDYALLKLNFSYAVLVEDDLLIAPDFYQYFSSLRRALDSDDSIFCVSAWNDNGQVGLVSDDPQLLHRTDFFPGLGWMINRRSWQRVRPLWPKSRYDDFLRSYMLNNSLVCVRPELSRTFNIGRNGGRHCDTEGTYTSNFYQNYLSRIVLNQHNVILSKIAIDKIIGRSADLNLDKLARSLPAMSLSHFLSTREPPSAVRIRYRTAEEFIALALRIGAIPEVWFGVPRASIMGICVVSTRGCRVYIVPDKRLPISSEILGPWVSKTPETPERRWGIFSFLFN